MSVPAVRNVITYKETTCIILNKTLETKFFGKVAETRGLLNVRTHITFFKRLDTIFQLLCWV